MNIKELREGAIELNQKAYAILKDSASTEDQLTEATRMTEEADAKEVRAAKLEALEAREKAYNEIADRPPVGETTVEARGEVTSENEQRAFQGWLRGDISNSEFRAQSVGTPADGGYLVPTGFVPNLVEVMKAYGPLNEGGPATYLNTATGNSLLIPTTNSTAKGSKVAENGAASEQALSFGQKQLDAYKYTSGVILVSNELMQDSAINLVDFITKSAGERLGRIANQELTIGDGVGDPEGIVTGSTAGVTAAGAAAITYDDLINLEHSVDPSYWGNAGYMFNSATLGLLRKLKDADGRPLWTPSMIVGAPNTINGKAYYVNQDMANATTGLISVLFGDFSKYTVRKVASVGIKRLDQNYAVNDQTGFVCFVRLDGAIMDATAIKRLTQA